MSENELRNDLKVTVLIGLAGICKQMVEHPATPKEMRQQAQTYVSQLESLLPARGKGNPEDHMQAEMLLEQIARFLARIVEMRTYPATGVR